MNNSATSLGLWIALAVSIAFICCHLKGKQKPDLGQSAVVFLATVGMVVAADFGFSILQANSSCSTVCQDQRLMMVVGAGAVEWISIGQVFKSFKHVLG